MIFVSTICENLQSPLYDWQGRDSAATAALHVRGHVAVALVELSRRVDSRL